MIIVIAFITTFAIAVSCYAGLLYLTSKETNRDIIESVFIVGFACLWVFLAAAILILIQHGESKAQETILQLELELEKVKKE